MTHTTEAFRLGRGKSSTPWAAAAALAAGLALAAGGAAAGQNLLKNPGFEESAPGLGDPPNWATTAGSAGKARLTDKEAHGGRNAIAIPAHTAVEQKLNPAAAGAYLARCWVKSESAQTVTFLLQDSDKPWAAYTLAEIKVPQGQWAQLESFCVLDQNGSLTLTLGGMSREFNLYHGTGGEMGSPITADDFEVVRCAPQPSAKVEAWDAKEELGAVFHWSAKGQWLPVDGPAHVFAGTPVIQGRHLAGAVRKSDGGLMVYSVQEGGPKLRCVIAPAPAIAASRMRRAPRA